MKTLLAFSLCLFAIISNAANPSTKSFRASGGLTVTSNDVTGMITYDGSGISSPTGGVTAATATNIAEYFSTNTTGRPSPPLSSVQFNSNGVMQGSAFFVFTNGSTAAKLDVTGEVHANGRVSIFGIGTSNMASALSITGNGSTDTSCIELINTTNYFDSKAAIHAFKSRNGSTVQSGDHLFQLSSLGWNGSQYIDAAQIRFTVDGTPSGADSMPSRIVFETRSVENTGGTYERVRITSAGNVGIGTNAPKSLLGVSGNASIGLTYSGIAAPGSSLIIEGKLGIGTTTPSAILDVSNAVGSATQLFHAGTNAFGFNITANSMVGIGTATPVDALELRDSDKTALTLYSDANFRITSTNTTGIDKGASLSLGGVVTGGTAWGFGALKGAKANNTDGNLDGYLALFTTRDGVGSVEGLRVAANGNVGIGTMNPSSTLDVTGQVRAASAIITNSVSVRTSDGTPRAHTAVIPGAPTFGGEWFGNITPSALNWSVGGDGASTYLNTPSGGEMYFSQDGNTLAWMNTAGDLTLFSGQFQLGGTNAGFPALGRMTNGSGGNGDLIVNGADGVFTGASTNRLLVPGGIGVGILTPTNSNGISVRGNATLHSNVFLPNLRTNGSPVALLGVDAAGAVFESAVGSAGGFSVSGNSNQIPFLNVAGTGFLFGSHDKSAPGFGMVNRANGNIGALLIHVNENEDVGLVQIGPPNAGSSIATFVPSLSISNRYDGGLTQEMVRVNYVDVGGTDAESMLQTWRNWDSAGVNLVSYSGLRKDGRLSLAGGLRLQGGATLTNVLYGTATLNFPSTVAGTASDLPITVTGAADGDIVSLGVPSGSIGPIIGSYSAWASNDVVYVRFACNTLVTAQDPASGLFRVRVDRFAP